VIVELDEGVPTYDVFSGVYIDTFVGVFIDNISE
jgi:hypothetical protein